jgi:8-oxo-dGTP diphosphatase
MPHSPQYYSAVFAVFEDEDGRALLSERANTGWRDGWHTLPSGHIEPGEMPSEALAREAREEAGVEIQEFSHFATIFRHNPERTYIDFFYRVTKWQGDLRNAEPNKCAGLTWHLHNDLPLQTLPFVAEVLNLDKNKTHLLEVRWG